LTIDEFIIKTERLKREILEKDPPLKLASYSVLALQSERIFTKGQNVDGTTHQYNSTDPLYVNPKTSPGKKFKPKGKPKAEGEKGASKKTVNIKFGGAGFSKGKPSKIETDRKTKWFESYKAYREEIGFKTEKVNLQLSGELKSDFENPRGKEPTPTEVDVHEYVIKLNKELSTKKVEKFDEKYGDVFGLSKFEIEEFYRIAALEFVRLASE
jgi:hypothetical protein